jgi:hypothetical protein
MRLERGGPHENKNVHCTFEGALDGAKEEDARVWRVRRRGGGVPFLKASMAVAREVLSAEGAAPTFSSQRLKIIKEPMAREIRAASNGATRPKLSARTFAN